MNQVDELEQAILARAQRLADEYRERASRTRDGILRDSAERLRLREAREEGIAKTLAERVFHQRVQASELKMQTQLDRVRWNLVQSVERGLANRMRTFMEDEEAYTVWLDKLVLSAAQAIESTALIVNASQQDQHRLYTRWDLVTREIPEGKRLTLAPKEEAISTLGGVIVSSADGRIRVDHSFEGRLERLRPRIQQVILERLLPGGLETGSALIG